MWKKTLIFLFVIAIFFLGIRYVSNEDSKENFLTGFAVRSAKDINDLTNNANAENSIKKIGELEEPKVEQNNLNSTKKEIITSGDKGRVEVAIVVVNKSN